MMRTLVSLSVLLLLTSTAPAQSLFAKKPKVNPSQRVPELIVALKTESDERKRLHAVEELRDYDAATFTEIVPAMIDVMQHDKKLNVRLEAATTLSKLRPVSAAAGQALEKASSEDESWRMRLHAKAALTKYHLAGYSPKKMEAPAVASKQPAAPLPSVVNKRPTDEPPLAEPSMLPPPRTFAPSSPPAPRPLPLAPKAPGQGDGPSLFP